MMIRPVVVSLLVIALSGCGESVGPPRAPQDSLSRDPGATPTTGALPESRRVVCDGGQRVSGTVDYAMEAFGSPTPEEAVRGWVQPAADEHLSVDEGAATAEVFVVRSDGTASAALDLLRTSSGGWVVETLEACEGALLRHPGEPDGG